jgi:EAL domain-containing protein (putative c-di-GMP-specific phosphodiesterase class I)
LQPRNLEIGINETALIQQAGRAIANITKLNELGIRIGIADFGSGFSPISYLTYLPIHSISLRSAAAKRTIDACTRTDPKRSCLPLPRSTRPGPEAR